MDPYDYSASNRERAKKEWKERKREAGRRDWKALYQSDPTPPEQCPSEGQFGPCTQQCEQPAGHDGQHRAQCFVWDEYMCICPAYRFNEQGDVEGLPQGTNPDCRHCHPQEQP